MSIHDPTIAACHPGQPVTLEPFPRGTLVLTPAGSVEVFIAVNASNLAVTTMRCNRQVEVNIWQVEQLVPIGASEERT